MEQEIFPVIRDHKLGLMAFSPLAAGKIAPGRTAEPGTPLADVLRVMDDVARELNVSRAQLAIAWVLTHPEVTSSLAGAEKPEHVEDNVAGSRLVLPPESLEALNAASDAYMRRTAAA
jgi:aryl-alcohol dehydrogenase-like predicted oxidoreductase